jgi:predicted amidohydrolase
VTRIACAQLAPVLGDLAANLETSTAAIAEAVSAGAQIVVLPELATSGYMFRDADEARAVALPAGDAALDRWVAAAGDALVIGGFCELGADATLHNSALVIDRGEVAGCYRKTHLWDREKLIFTPGDRLPPVLTTRYGAVAVMVCYDLEFPEVTRAVAVQGAELIVAPVNWPRMPRPEGERIGEVITAMSAATARLRRNTRVESKTPITKISTVRFKGSTDRTTKATISDGTAIIKSTTRDRPVSIHPPRVAARKPKNAPIPNDKSEDTSATKIVTDPP